MMASRWTSSTLLLLAAAIWGFAFVAQRAGMEHVGPFTFNAVRFALGGLALLPIVLIRRRETDLIGSKRPFVSRQRVLFGGLVAGAALFFGASLQQIGIIFTTAGKAGFITGLYVIIVPIIGLLWRQRTGVQTWLGAMLAMVGLYLLSMSGGMRMAEGDLLVLLGAFMWAGHVHLIGWLSPKNDPLQLACCQFLVCSGLSLIAVLFFETVFSPVEFFITITSGGLRQAAIPILYAGLLSTGVAYTLQVVAQRRAHPSHAAILLSLEAVFAAVGGWLMLGELFSLRELFGCLLMLAGMLLSQIEVMFSEKGGRHDPVAAQRGGLVCLLPGSGGKRLRTDGGR
jgi:drug/metabolite transporter (DMT)-like permease